MKTGIKNEFFHEASVAYAIRPAPALMLIKNDILRRQSGVTQVDEVEKIIQQFDVIT